jgi:hypothetical protein
MMYLNNVTPFDFRSSALYNVYQSARGAGGTKEWYANGENHKKGVRRRGKTTYFVTRFPGFACSSFLLGGYGNGDVITVTISGYRYGPRNYEFPQLMANCTIAIVYAKHPVL